MSWSAVRRERQRAARRAGIMKLLIAAATVTGYAAVSCSGEHDSSPRATGSDGRTPAPSRGTPAALAGAVVAGGEVSQNGADSAAPPIRWLSDANLLSLLSIMNARQIAAAQVELDAWHLSAVRAFALAMARDHLALQRSIDSLAQRLELQPVRPAVADQITAEFQARIDAMAAQRWGPRGSLDRAFVAQQIVSHQAMATYLSAMTGSAEQPDVRLFLSSAATRVGAQLASARSMQSSLALADSTVADSGTIDSAAVDSIRISTDSVPVTTDSIPAFSGSPGPGSAAVRPDSTARAVDSAPRAVDSTPGRSGRRVDSTAVRPKRPAGDSIRPPGR